MKHLKHLLLVCALSATTVFAAASWSGTASFVDGQIISAQSIKNNFTYLYERRWEFLGDTNNPTHLYAGDNAVAAVEYCDETGANCFTADDITNIMNSSSTTVIENNPGDTYSLRPVIAPISIVWDRDSLKKINNSRYEMTGMMTVPEGVNLYGHISPGNYGTGVMYQVSPGDKIPYTIPVIDYETQSGNQYWKWITASASPNQDDRLIDPVFIYANQNGYAVLNNKLTPQTVGVAEYTGSVPGWPWLGGPRYLAEPTQAEGLPVFWYGTNL